MGRITRRRCSFLLLTLISIKLFVIINAYIRRKSKIVNTIINVEDVIFKNEDDTFVIMNEKNVEILLRPPDCSPRTRLVLLVSSGHDNSGARSVWRRRLSEVTGPAQPDTPRLVFLVSSCPQGARCEVDLSREHDLHGDILHTSLEDGHRRLGYKILSGYIWTHLSCGEASHVVKTDDNVLLDIPALLSVTLSAGRSPDGLSVLCGCGPPHRNMKTLRSSSPRMLGNWSVPRSQMEADTIPDFCAGFLYSVSPVLGARLVQAGAKVFGGHSEDIVLIEDSLITGVLRQSIGDVDIGILGDSRTRWLWSDILSHCPWLTVAKMTFFDDLVIRKTSDRSGVQYVGSVWDASVWRFFLCLHIETVLGATENTFSIPIPNFIWDVCKR